MRILFVLSNVNFMHIIVGVRSPRPTDIKDYVEKKTVGADLCVCPSTWMKKDLNCYLNVKGEHVGVESISTLLDSKGVYDSKGANIPKRHMIPKGRYGICPYTNSPLNAFCKIDFFNSSRLFSFCW